MYFDEENWKMDTDLGKSNDRDWCNGIPPLQAFISFVVSAFLCAVGGIMIIGTGELIEDTNQIKCMLMDWMEKQNLMTEQNHHEQGVYNDKVEYYRNYRSRR